MTDPKTYTEQDYVWPSTMTEPERVEERLAEWRVEYRKLESELLSKEHFYQTRTLMLNEKLNLADKIALAEKWLAGQRAKKDVDK
jgi:hypothetical protein